jgi:urease accessory protein
LNAPAPPPAPLPAALLLLADGRLPTGGYAHSGGVEAAVAAGRISGIGDLEAYLTGRLATSGALDTAAACAAWAACTTSRPLGCLDAEVAARIPSPALRAAGRSQARGLARLARRAWPGPAVAGLAGLHPDGPCWPVALGAVAAAAGLDAEATAVLAGMSAVSGPAWAAVRLLGLDPLAVATVLADLTPAVERVAADSLRWAATDRDPSDLPAPGGPLLDVGAEDHATWEVRLFAS